MKVTHAYILLPVVLLLGWIPSSEQACGTCANHAFCNPETNKCECNRRYSGIGSLYCHRPNMVNCSVFADPVIYGFSGGRTRIKLACKVHLAMFDVWEGSRPKSFGDIEEGMITEGTFEEQDAPIGRCRYTVMADIQMSPKGQYYVGELDIKIVVNRGKPLYFNLERVEIQLSGTVARYKENRVWFPFGKWKQLPYGQCTYVVVAGVTIPICHNADANTWQISTQNRRCAQTVITYRPWDTSVEHQHQTAGVFISHTGKVEDTKYSSYPWSFCDNARGTDMVYKQYQKENDLATLYGSSVYAMLAAPALQTNTVCRYLAAKYLLCPGRRVGAVNECQNIVLRWATCAEKKNEDPVNVFRMCFWGFCRGKQRLCNQAASKVTNPDVEGCPTSSVGLFSC